MEIEWSNGLYCLTIIGTFWPTSKIHFKRKLYDPSRIECWYQFYCNQIGFVMEIVTHYFFDLEWIRFKMKSASVRLENGLQTKRCFNYTHSTQHIQWNPFNCCNFTMLIYIPLAFSNPLINENYNSHLLIREKKQKKNNVKSSIKRHHIVIFKVKMLFQIFIDYA